MGPTTTHGPRWSVNGDVRNSPLNGPTRTDANDPERTMSLRGALPSLTP